MAKEPILIVGGGRAAASLIDAYREEGGDALITVVSTDDQPPYNRPPLSKGVLRGEMEPLEALVHTAEEWDDNLVELRLETSVEAVDTDGRTVTLAGGETLPYGTLVIASGARPRTLPASRGRISRPYTPTGRSRMRSTCGRRRPTHGRRSSSEAASSARRSLRR